MLGYYNFFPPKSMNVSVEEKGENKRKVLIATKDFEKGDVIYKVRMIDFAFRRPS